MDFGDLLGKLDDSLGGEQAGQLGDLIALVTKNRAALESLGKLPGFLAQLADALSGAGEQARSASVALVGADGMAGVRGTLDDTAEAVADIATALGKGVAKIADAAEAAARVPLMDGPASRLAGAAEEMGETTSRLGDLADGLETIADTLTKVGAALARLGDHLDDSGTHARGFAELG
ncbi:MAG: hypothetical protein WAW88_11380 [Nocardioides sp.]